nr:MAG TPA: hypothetical protein [Caudoviricetes sp.]
MPLACNYYITLWHSTMSRCNGILSCDGGHVL